VVRVEPPLFPQAAASDAVRDEARRRQGGRGRRARNMYLSSPMDPGSR